MKIPGLKILDLYIIRKFLGTFFFSIILIILIAVVFDFSEKVDDFIENNAPFKAIVFEYYFNFIPYFTVLFSPLFTFIAVIYFTSRMAYNTEIIAILSSGVGFSRIMRPYFIGATIIAVFAFLLTNFVLPDATRVKLEFEETYYHSRPKAFGFSNVHRQIEPGVVIYMENYNTSTDYGRKFSIERFENGELVSKLLSEDIRWDTPKNKWIIRNYYVRDYNGNNQTISTGSFIDTTLNLSPDEFRIRDEAIEAMALNELNSFIKEQRAQGASNVERLLIEKYKRFSFPFSTFILTIIGVSVSSRKAKGGTGLHIGMGLLVSFSYLLFMQFSTQFAISGAIDPFLAVWIPNILFAFVAFYLYRLAPK